MNRKNIVGLIVIVVLMAGSFWVGRTFTKQVTLGSPTESKNEKRIDGWSCGETRLELIETVTIKSYACSDHIVLIKTPMKVAVYRVVNPKKDYYDIFFINKDWEFCMPMFKESGNNYEKFIQEELFDLYQTWDMIGDLDIGIAKSRIMENMWVRTLEK